MIVEDIVDSGFTLEALCNQLLLRNPASLRVCTLVDKRAQRATEVAVDYVITSYSIHYTKLYEVFVPPALELAAWSGVLPGWRLKGPRPKA